MDLFGEFAHQLADGSFGRWWDSEGNAIDRKGTNGAYIGTAMMRLLPYAGDERDAFLSAALQLLSQLPFFSHILVRCLRKQERSMWPFAVQNAEDIKSLYLQFLFNNDMEYAVTTISILQGLLCSVGNAWNASTQAPLQIETWKQALQGSEEWLIDDYSEVFCCKLEGECVAHLSGLQLLFVAIIRGEYALLADIYRFLLMEVGIARAFQRRKRVTTRRRSRFPRLTWCRTC